MDIMNPQYSWIGTKNYQREQTKIDIIEHFIIECIDKVSKDL